MSDKPHPMVFDVLSMDGDFDEACNRLFGFSPNSQDTRADDEIRELEKDVQNLDDLISQANPGAKERMATIRRNAAIDLILASRDEALNLKFALYRAIDKSPSEDQDEAIRQHKREAMRELIGQIVDLKVACGSLEEEKKAIGRILEDSIKVTSLNIRNSQELSEQLFEAKKRLADHDVLSAKLVTFQLELRSRGMTTKLAVEDLLLALARLTWPLHDDSNNHFLEPNQDCQHPCCYVHGGGMSDEGPQEPPADATEAPAEVAVPSPAPKPTTTPKRVIIPMMKGATTGNPRGGKTSAKKPTQAPKPAPTEKPKGKRRPAEGGHGW